MGLRPSVHGNSSRKSPDETDDTQGFEDIDNSSRGNATEGDKSANPSSPTSTDSLPPVQRQAWTERGQLLLNFHDVISRAINSPEMIQKCSKIAADMSENENEDATSKEHKSGSLADDYGAEANLIIENKAKRDAEVRNKTMAVGLCVFGVLRGGRGTASWMRNAAVRASRYRFHSLPSSGVKDSNFTSPKLPTDEQPTKLRRFFRLAVDFTLSTTIALFSGQFLFIPRPSSYIEDMAKLPMVEGKSLYAEMVCPPLLKEYKHVLEKYGRWPVMSPNDVFCETDGKAALTQEDVSLNIIRKFAENCSKRSKYEQAVLQERNALANHRDQHPGLELFHRITKGKYSKDSKDEWVKLGDVNVPSGGVPEDISVNLEKDVLSLDEAQSKELGK